MPAEQQHQEQSLILGFDVRVHVDLSHVVKRALRSGLTAKDVVERMRRDFADTLASSLMFKEGIDPRTVKVEPVQDLVRR